MSGLKENENTTTTADEEEAQVFAMTMTSTTDDDDDGTEEGATVPTKTTTTAMTTTTTRRTTLFLTVSILLLLLLFVVAMTTIGIRQVVEQQEEDSFEVSLTTASTATTTSSSSSSTNFERIHSLDRKALPRFSRLDELNLKQQVIVPEYEENENEEPQVGDPCDSNPCNEEEVCVSDLNSGSYTCELESGYTYATDYVVVWKSRGGGSNVGPFFKDQYSGCQEPLPTMKASCGDQGKIFIFDHDIGNHNCHRVNDRTIECDAQKDGIVPVWCETSDPDEATRAGLVLTVSLPEVEDLKCNGYIDFVSQRGGDAQQTLIVFTSCSSSSSSSSSENGWATMQADECIGTTMLSRDGRRRFCQTKSECHCDAGRPLPFDNCEECYVDLKAIRTTTVGPLDHEAGCIYRID